MKKIEDIEWLWQNDENHSRGIIRLDYNEGLLLGKYASLVNGTIVEIGTRNGGSAYLLAYFSNSNVITIDLRKLNNSFMLDKLINLDPPVTFMHGDSREVTPPDTYDMLFIDGRHRLESVLSDTNRFWNNCSKYIVYHDYSKSIGVTRVVDFLIEKKFCTKLDQSGSLIVLKKQTNLLSPITL